MAKKNGVAKFPVKHLTEAMKVGSYVVPAEKQEALRSMNRTGAELQRKLGELRTAFLMQEGELMQRMQQNKVAFNQMVRTIAEDGGIDLKGNPGDEWNFDMESMTFRRTNAAPPPPPTVAPPQAIPQQG